MEGETRKEVGGQEGTVANCAEKNIGSGGGTQELGEVGEHAVGFGEV